MVTSRFPLMAGPPTFVPLEGLLLGFSAPFASPLEGIS